MPPDGEFELMNYRMSENIQLPFRVLPSVTEPSQTLVEVNITPDSATHVFASFAVDRRMQKADATLWTNFQTRAVAI